MEGYQPLFTITPEVLSLAVEIGELIGRISGTAGLSASPVLRRTNRIRSVYSSLAIEQNTLTLDQVTAVLNGKRVIAPPKDIAEVQNAFEIYEQGTRCHGTRSDRGGGAVSQRKCGHRGRGGPRSALWDASGVCARPCLSAPGLDQGQPHAHADQKLRVSL